jgi:hypothetical protein
MRRREAIGGLAAGAAVLWTDGRTSAATESVSQAAAVAATPEIGRFPLIRRGHAAPIHADADDFPAVLRAVRGLQSDLSRLSGHPVALSIGAIPQAKTPIVVGTLGRSRLIDRLVERGQLDVGAIAGQWEAFVRQRVLEPAPGVDEALVLAGADRRGTVFAVYDLAERIGISPWAWWADVPVRRRTELHVGPDRFTDKPAVRYRGIFLNDEEPALGGWTRQRFGGFNHQFYERIFELILRLKGNFLWPAMWDKAIYDDDPLSPALAEEMGVVLGTSHHEPLMRAHVEWARYGAGPWDYTQNEARLRAFWHEGIKRMGGNESLVTIGMRGDGDKPMTEGVAIALLERIVRDQREIIAEVTARPAAQTPQVWALYKEVQDYYDRGMRVPEDVTLLFGDDNWGNLRRLPPPGTKRLGGYGIYYHFDYVGGPRSYKWLNTNQIERTWEQMRLAHQGGVDRIWIVNVGDLKPMEFPTSFFLDLAWNPGAYPLERLRDYPREWAARQFGEEHAAEIGALLRRYTQLNARRKPELLGPDTYSLVNFREAERVVSEYNALAATALQLRDRLPGEYHDAYFQLVLFPIQACANLNDLHVTTGRNHLYAAQGRAATSAMAKRVQALFARDAQLTRQYQEQMAGGKWDHMMSQSHIGYTGWHDPAENIMPEVRIIEVPQAATLGVAIEGSTGAWPGDPSEPVLPELTPFTTPSRYIDVFNRGLTPYLFEAIASRPWIHVSPSHGEVKEETRLEVSAEWPSVPSGEHLVPIVIQGAGSTISVTARIVKPPLAAEARGYIEANGHVAIEAAHYSRAVDGRDMSWSEIPALGRTLSGVAAFSTSAAQHTPGGESPHLQYDVYLFSTGEVSIHVILSPTLDFNGEGLRYAISIDDERPQIVNIHSGTSDKLWSTWASNNANVQSTRHRVGSTGAHTVKLWLVDLGLVFQRVVLELREIPPSYLGPLESTRI